MTGHASALVRAAMLIAAAACTKQPGSGPEAAGAHASASTAGHGSVAGVGSGVASAGTAALGVAGSNPPSAGDAVHAGAGAATGGVAGSMVVQVGSPAADGGAGSTGAGGASASGAGGGAADGGAAGSAASSATPSAGCAKAAARPASGVVKQSDRIYDFPISYDGKTPMPLLLALHAAGNPNTQLESLTKGSRLETSFVRVFPKSAGSAWVYNTDIANVKAILDDVLANYCIDTSHMFGTGHSSGAQMLVQMLCNGEKRFRGVAPVAASKYCAKVAAMPVMYIQGMMDAQRGGGNGSDVVNVFAASNACGASTLPKGDVPSCVSTFDHMAVTPGCVSYQGCMQPTVWCSHNDNGYNSTDGREHGWPCFASGAIADFFLGLP